MPSSLSHKNIVSTTLSISNNSKCSRLLPGNRLERKKGLSRNGEMSGSRLTNGFMLQSTKAPTGSSVQFAKNMGGNIAGLEFLRCGYLASLFGRKSHNSGLVASTSIFSGIWTVSTIGYHHQQRTQMLMGKLTNFLVWVDWKDICRDHSVFEVLKRMMEVHMPTNKKRKEYRKFAGKQSRIFTMQLAFGLLNVIVMSMKIGLWDRLYDTFQEENKHKYIEAKTTHISRVIDMEPLKARAQVLSIKEENLPSVTENGLSIDEEFLEKQLSGLPERIMRILIVHKYRNSLVAAYIAEHQMLLFLSQVAWELNDDTTMTIEEIAVLLHKQFPLISFELSDSHSVQESVDCSRNYEGFCLQRNTMYLATLLARRTASDSSMLTPNILGSTQK
eukprot:Gb_22417 [translate_table: standard]